MTRNRKGYAEALVQERTGRAVDDLLRELYVEKRHSQQEIATAFGVSRVLISQWLAKYGITRDERPPVVL